MQLHRDRRRFLHTSGLLLAGAAWPSAVAPLAVGQAAEGEPRIKKAVGWQMIGEGASVEDKLRIAKDAGFEGVEVSAQQLNRDSPQSKEFAAAAAKLGVRIHGLVGAGRAGLAVAIEEAAGCGADSVLFVVRSDPNTPYWENYRRGQETIRAAIPQAEKNKVAILIENVWATFLIEPLAMQRFIDELKSPWVKSYFDVGNVMRWGVPQHWIEVLGKRVGKIHIKEYSMKLAMNEGLAKGFNVPIGEGDINWKAVMAELRRIGFQSWATAEVGGGDRKRLAEISAQMDRVLAM